ncbi:MAG TPA: hypothetical protein VFF98_16890, partial [Novosphingobium sp.]|nr:hypothetical protein [Novosphingobium sp.]
PLGLKARALLALALALCGALAGFGLGRLLGRSHRRAITESEAEAPAMRARAAQPVAQAAAKPEPMRVRRADAHPDAPARRPIRAHEELGEEGLPMPAEAPVIAAAPVIMPEPETAPAVILAPAPATVAEAPALPRMQPLAREAYEMPPAPPASAPEAPEEEAPVGAERLCATPLDHLSQVELVERLAIAMQRRREAAEQAGEGGQQRAPSPATTNIAGILKAIDAMNGRASANDAGVSGAEEAPAPPAGRWRRSLAVGDSSGWIEEEAEARPAASAPAPDAESTLRSALASLRELR